MTRKILIAAALAGLLATPAVAAPHALNAFVADYDADKNGEVTQAEFEAPRVGFFPSIRATLNHTYTVDLYYFDAIERGVPPFTTPMSLPTGESLVAR